MIYLEKSKTHKGSTISWALSPEASSLLRLLHISLTKDSYRYEKKENYLDQRTLKNFLWSMVKLKLK